MKIDAIRIYAEVLEQGIDFKEYILKSFPSLKITNVYTKKGRSEFRDSDTYIDRIRKCKDVDVLISIISDKKEYPLLMVEYSTAVPTDDHKMQRSDVYYWSSKFNVPMMKIYPSEKGMNQSFGGGDKFNDEMEMALSYANGGVFFPIKWKTIEGLDTLKTKEGALSCIYYSDDIFKIINNLIKVFKEKNDFLSFFDRVRSLYYEKNKLILNSFTRKKMCSYIVNSTRFNWINDKYLTSKINRFGHAMDPDRGVLYFANMLVGIDNCITEIQVNRNSIDGRGGYKALFDATPHEKILLKFVSEIYNNKNNVMSSSDAISILECSLNIKKWELFRKVNEKEYIIEDEKLRKFFNNSPSITAKSIFFLSLKLILTDKDRNIICTISWGYNPVKEFLNSLICKNFKPLNIKELSIADAKEDIITFASVALYKKMLCELIAVSYPGAQGDRCILIGKGRNVDRKYIDIIALKKEKITANVFLQESKDNFSKSANDVKKLNEIISSKIDIDGLKELIHKVTLLEKSKISQDIKISIGSKYSSDIANYDVDYIFMFDIDNSKFDKTIIKYSVALIDTSLLLAFKPLLDKDGKLKGTLEFDKIFIIN